MSLPVNPQKRTSTATITWSEKGQQLSSPPACGGRGAVRLERALLRITSVDFVGLEIASSCRKKWRVDAHLGRAFRQIADRMLTFGGPTVLHVNQYRRPIGRFRLRKHATHNGRCIGSWRRGRRIPCRRDDPRTFVDNATNERRTGG